MVRRRWPVLRIAAAVVVGLGLAPVWAEEFAFRITVLVDEERPIDVAYKEGTLGVRYSGKEVFHQTLTRPQRVKLEGKLPQEPEKRWEGFFVAKQPVLDGNVVGFRLTRKGRAREFMGENAAPVGFSELLKVINEIAGENLLPTTWAEGKASEGYASREKWLEVFGEKVRRERAKRKR